MRRSARTSAISTYVRASVRIAAPGAIRTLAKIVEEFAEGVHTEQRTATVGA